jgi:hypothetical protein
VKKYECHTWVLFKSYNKHNLKFSKQFFTDLLCEKLIEAGKADQNLSVVIVAEGTTNQSGEPITCQQIKQVITEKLHYVSPMKSFKIVGSFFFTLD